MALSMQNGMTGMPSVTAFGPNALKSGAHRQATCPNLSATNRIRLKKTGNGSVSVIMVQRKKCGDLPVLIQAGNLSLPADGPCTMVITAGFRMSHSVTLPTITVHGSILNQRAAGIGHLPQSGGPKPPLQSISAWDVIRAGLAGSTAVIPWAGCRYPRLRSIMVTGVGAITLSWSTALKS